MMKAVQETSIDDAACTAFFQKPFRKNKCPQKVIQRNDIDQTKTDNRIILQQATLFFLF